MCIYLRTPNTEARIENAMAETAAATANFIAVVVAVAVMMQKSVITSRTIFHQKKSPSIIYPQVNFNFRFWLIFQQRIYGC